jgi:peptidoglycan/xylan/chitin deacetylase (PgdA/CDA1 family)
MFFRTPFFLPWIYPQLEWGVATKQKKIFLTFDDGPVPGPTEFVLDTLRKFSAQATFFCIGDNVRKHPHIFQQILSAGHRAGNHTFHHVKGWGVKSKIYEEEVTLCQQQMEEAGMRLSPYESPLFRPPYGRITHEQIRHLKDYRIVMWSVLTRDYQALIKPEQCLEGSLRATRPGSIVVFHDSVKAEKNLRFALPRYLQFFSEQGYSFELL